MISVEHHYGAKVRQTSTPFWSMGATHQIGAQERMSSTNNIQRFREERGWKRPELARRMRTSPQQIERLEKGMRDLRLDWIDRAAEAFGVTPAEIISPLAEGHRLPAEPDIPPTVSASRSDGSITIRQIDLSFAMGPGTNLDDYAEEMPIEFDAGVLRALTRSPAENLVIARGDGDSMMPTLINGDMVLIDTAQQKLNLQDRIWAVSVYGAGMIKRLRAIGEDRVQVISDNPTVPAQEVGAEDIAIVGRVIWVGRRV